MFTYANPLKLAYQLLVCMPGNYKALFHCKVAFTVYRIVDAISIKFVSNGDKQLNCAVR